MATQFLSSARKRLSTGSRKASDNEAPGNAELPKEIPKDLDKFGLFRIYAQDATKENAEPISELTRKSPDANEAGANDNVDIVAIHGLGGTAFKTWTHDNGRMWLRDFAPNQFPGARIFTFGYDSGIAFSRGTGTVSDFAKTLLEAIKLERQTPELNKRPLVWICHSMGGIVAKLALTIARNEPHNYPGIGQAVIAILFLGTPHQGSSYSRYANVLAQTANFLAIGTQASRFTGKARTDLLKSLESHESELLRIAEDFRVHTADIKIRSFVEGKNMKGLNRRIVDDYSAFVGAATERKIPMPGYDHRDICRHGSPTDLGLNLILGAIRECLSMEPLQRVSVPDPPRTPYLPYTNIPFQQNMEFVGQIQILNEIKSVLEDSPGDRQVALYGLGGIGKSQVALQYAYNYKRRRPSSSIFWIFAGSRKRFEQDYLQIATGLKLPGCNDPEADVLSLVKSSLEKSDSKDWLMIIDNVDDMSVLDGLSETESCSILKYIPNNAAGSILYTTRSKKNALRLTGEGNIIQISEMSMEDSKSLLRSKLRAETSNEELWIDLLEALERLPLAIVQAASYIRQNSWSISKYLRHFQSQDGNASIQFLQHDFQDKTREHTVANPVFKTWMITVRQLEDQHPRAAEALWLMAFYNRQNIPRYLLLNLTQPPPSNLLASDRRDDVQVVSQPEVKEDAELSLDLAIGTLVAYSFINVSDTERGENYTLHRLVHKFTRYWLKDYRRTADSWATKSLEFLSKEIPPFTYENWTKVTELLPHVEIILSYQPASHLPARGLGVLLSAAAYCSRAKAQYPLAEEYIRRAITTLSAALGAEDPLTMQARYFLALVCLDAGRYKEAEDTFRVLVRYLSDTLGENHEKVFFASSDLSNTLRVQKRYKEAEELATRAVFVLEKLYSPEAMRLLESKRILSTILTDMGEYKKAIEIQRAIWEVTQKEYGPEHPEPMLMKHNLAVTLANMGELEEARRMSQDVLKWNEKLLGPDHPLTINILFNLAYTLDREGNFAEAEDYYRRVLEHHLCYPGINDIEIIRCLRNLALCSESQNFYDEAAKYYHQAYERIRTLPDAKEAYADEILDDLARLSILQGNDTDAIEKSQEAEKQKLKAKELEAPESEGTSAGGRNRSRKWLGRAFYPYSPGSRNGKPG